MWALSSCVGTNMFPKGFSTEVTKSNVAPKNYKNIAIAGFGTSVTRLFFDNLYDALSVRLLKSNISTENSFAGNDSVVVKIALNKLITSTAYDAVLLVLPNSTGYVTEKNIANSSVTNQLEQNFKFAVFEKPGTDTAVWELSLNANIDFTQTKPYEALAKKIIESMKLNKLIP